MASNRNLHSAKDKKKDEFYTQLPDIERELIHYKDHFKGKTVLCNCDDPYESNFFKYFALNFNYFGLKKLTATCYRGSPISYTELPLFPELEPQEKELRPPYKAVISDASNFGNNGAFDLADIANLLKSDKNSCGLLQGDGDFRSEECVELLKEADIVVTNPPFSLFREFINLLVKYDKKFIIIGNKNAITYKEVFSLIKENKLWIGVTPMSKEVYFDVPQSYIDEAIENHKDRSVVRVDGKYVARSQSIWFTNLDNKKRHDELELFKTYNPEDYPKYDNYDAIEVSKATDVPVDYDGIMAVPVTFLDKYNPEQFEILGITQRSDDPFKTKYYTKDEYENANDLNARGVIMINGKPKSMYARILIKRRKM